MCLEERNTESRGRPLPAALTARRTRAWRRSVVLRYLPILRLRLFLLRPAERDHLAQQLAICSALFRRAFAPAAQRIGRHAQEDPIRAANESLERPDRLAIRDRAHFFFPSLRKMYSPSYFTP